MNTIRSLVALSTIGCIGIFPLISHAAEIYNQNGNRVYLDGSFKVRHYFSQDKYIAGDQSKVKFTLRGETKINDLMIGYARWEYNVKLNQPESAGSSKNTTRIGYAGIGFGQYGSFDYGRNYGILNDINGWTGAPIPVFGGVSYDGVDNFMTYRTNNVATYRNRNIFNLVDGLDFGLQIQGKNDGWNAPETQTGPLSSNPRGVAHQNGNGVGSSLIYRFGNGLSIGGAYANSARTLEQRQDDLGKRADGWNVGARYDNHNVYLAAIYGEVKNMHYIGKQDRFAPKARGYELLAQYQFDCGLKPSLAYLNGTAKDLKGNASSNQTYVKFIDLATTYSFNKNLALIFEYKINLLDDNTFTRNNGISTDDVFVTMLNYKF
ncbi:outer membrane porin [Edwardsiella ictaluri 93-146]|uniref:Outer membrane porin n=3 Tax=Edwardsiella ictaluri TaxID=67780 RepID=C5BC47_EDWI9|nr:outer membrane porin [Edwardsiella ictaluri 93-146]STP85870.1 Porin ompk36 [Edwardsiella ictaluri]